MTLDMKNVETKFMQIMELLNTPSITEENLKAAKSLMLEISQALDELYKQCQVTAQEKIHVFNNISTYHCLSEWINAMKIAFMTEINSNAPNLPEKLAEISQSNQTLFSKAFKFYQAIQKYETINIGRVLISYR